MLAAGVFAAEAAADARVSINGGTLTVSVAPTEPGNHNLHVEPYSDVSRNGWKVGMQFGVSGAPAILTFDSDCFGNSVFNDVVCNGQRNALTITMAGGNDDVVVDDAGGLTHDCLSGTPVPKVATVNLGGGADFLHSFHGCSGRSVVSQPSFEFRYVADGGSGNDTLQSGVPTALPNFISDNFKGGSGSDTLLGESGDDTLEGETGNDTLKGNAGNDTLKGDAGHDILQGFGDDDTLDGGADNDTVQGGDGFDTASYSGRDVGVTVRLDGFANDGSAQDDGPAGGRDNVSSDVERILGSPRNDTLVGDAGEQTLIGNAGNDEITGGSGRDTISGGGDNDTLDTRDGVEERSIDCGPGTDTARVDLQEQLTGSFRKTCETVSSFALDDGPPGIALKQRLRSRNGKVKIRVSCPRRARIACRGRLTLRRVGSRRVLARHRYRVGLGKKGTVTLAVRSKLPARVVAEMREQGVSDKGPRSSSRVLRVSRRR
jgi:Ca2+-binding RTX toxin-like protein